MSAAALARALAATHAAAFAPESRWSEDAIAAALAAPGAVLAGDAACFVLGRVTLDEAEILTLATRPDLRREGRARRALARFESRARALGARMAFLEVDEVNAPAIALYLGAGYRPCGRRRGYYLHAQGRPTDALVLRRDLDPAADPAAPR
ncbi:MAG: GNAT family N-acetyltransferase [Rubellimicrobium sp.]|nr:GNAT family N-acetyltransferase [Rubellimicrobium sp.]